MPPVIKKDRCTGCGVCVDICSMDVFFGSKKGKNLAVCTKERITHLPIHYWTTSFSRSDGLTINQLPCGGIG